MRAGHFPPAFSWLPLTTLNPANYVDHHLLFHVILIPFTWFGDLQTGAKVAAIVFGSAAVLSCYWLVWRYRIRHRLIWLLALLAASAPFLYRLNMTKAPPLAIVFLAIGIFLLFERKYRALLPLAFAFTLTYDMFVLLIGAVAIWTIVTGWSEKRFEWRPAGWVLLGVVLGLVANPYFPHNLVLLWEHARVKLTTPSAAIKAGNEWDPYGWWEFVLNCYVALAAMLAGCLAFDGSDRRRGERPLFLLILSTALLLMTARWRRFAEYSSPFAILFAAFTLDQYWRRRADVTRVPLIAVALAVSLAANVYRTARDIRESAPREYYASGAAWMRANVPAGQLVFNTDWDDFPRLFFFDPTHAYVSGLDPAYLADENPDLSDLYETITSGQEQDPGPLIRDRFGASWVFTDVKDANEAFYRNAMRGGRVDLVYEDRDCRVLRIRDR